MIKSGGFRISPEEVENLLIASGAVHEACALGVDDPDGVVGQVVLAVVSLRDGPPGDAVQAIRDHMVANAPAYMVPREIVVVSELPKTPSGKIDRPEIRRVHAA